MANTKPTLADALDATKYALFDPLGPQGRYPAIPDHFKVARDVSRPYPYRDLYGLSGPRVQISSNVPTEPIAKGTSPRELINHLRLNARNGIDKESALYFTELLMRELEIALDLLDKTYDVMSDAYVDGNDEGMERRIQYLQGKIGEFTK